MEEQVRRVLSFIVSLITDAAIRAKRIPEYNFCIWDRRVVILLKRQHSESERENIITRIFRLWSYSLSTARKLHDRQQWVLTYLLAPQESPSAQSIQQALEPLVQRWRTQTQRPILTGTRISDMSVRPISRLNCYFLSQHTTLSPRRNRRRAFTLIYTSVLASRSYVSIYPSRSPARSCSGLSLALVSFVRAIDVSTPIRLKAYICAIDSNN